MDDTKRITEANRRAWNEATPLHQRHRTVDLRAKFAEPGYSCLDPIETAKLLQIGLAGQRVAQLCCNNGREILSLVNLGAAEGVGFDISDAAIAEAEELARIAGANCRFVRTDVYDIGREWDGRFDLVYITIGALSWLPDLGRFFGVAARLLAPGAALAVYEQHPFLYLFPTPGDPEYDSENELTAVFSYFRTAPWEETQGIDYIGGTTYASPTSYSHTQKISDILNPILRSGLMLREFHEYPHDISLVWRHLEKYHVVPLCYLLVAHKPKDGAPAGP
ncbi:MAG TPA: class I SAM-dependent methyltransferase [candidate division Zixibacteria bacterium]|nr:class I SAM-dependent methyltransferase [candidate division Zixibacteria bacterium]HOD66361.1 class I SAM-dependent methyltransferase [candidate division Zixibacteria bacterium]HPM37654.1 class I SAM-dependent methyltransferase [candidate division Zixibacteria bacterium]HQL24692.1 class I SAM-dependent methyltransferase [candidate division Zixibacteria bacterium]